MKWLHVMLLCACACSYNSNTKPWHANYERPTASVDLDIERIPGDSLSITLTISSRDTTIYVDGSFTASWLPNKESIMISYGTNMEATPVDYIDRHLLVARSKPGVHSYRINQHIINHGLRGADIHLRCNYFVGDFVNDNTSLYDLLTKGSKMSIMGESVVHD